MKEDGRAKAIDRYSAELNKLLGYRAYVSITNIRDTFTLWMGGRKVITTKNLSEIQAVLRETVIAIHQYKLQVES